MTIDQLREELRRQANDHHDPADLRSSLARPTISRRQMSAAAAVAAAVVAVVLVGIAALRVAPGPRTDQVGGTLTTTSQTSSPPTRRTMNLVCAGAIAITGDPDQTLTEILGVVAINTSAQEVSDQQTVVHQVTDPAERYFAKSGLQIKAGRSFTLSVADDQLGKARIGWSNVAFEPGENLQAGPCSAPVTPTDRPDHRASEVWLTYPGGIWVAAPMCVELVVTASADPLPSGLTSVGPSVPGGPGGSVLQRQTIRIPVGAPCH